MRLRKILKILFALLVVGIGVSTYLLARPNQSKEPVLKLLFPNESTGESALWPLRNSWVWSISHTDPASSGTSFSLVARVVHKSIKNGQTPASMPVNISREGSEKELAFGTMEWLGTDSIIATVQFLDLGQIGVTSEKKPLRLLMCLKVNSGTMYFSGDNSVIEGKYVMAYHNKGDAQWKEGELHLQDFWVLSENEVAIYDIVLVQSESQVYSPRPAQPNLKDKPNP